MRPGRNCFICGSEMNEVLSLPKFPMTEMYEPYVAEFKEGTGLVDQALLYCEVCSYAGLKKVIPPEELYAKDYRTKTSSSVGASHSVNSFYDFIKRNLRIDDYYGTVIDIGANDSSLLSKFPMARRVAVDPNASGDAELIKDYIEGADLSQFENQRKLILCSHTLEHVSDPLGMLTKIRGIMGSADVCAFQFPSLDSLVRDARIDQVHHQHLHYFSLRAASLLLAKAGFLIFAHEFDDAHYGTLRLLFRAGAGEVLGSPIPYWRIDEALADFSLAMAAFGDSIKRLRSPVCYGASLMLPVLEYYVPELRQIDRVFDEDESKHWSRWINSNKCICPPVDVKGMDLVITAFNTKLAVRKIASKLSEQGARNICVPFSTL